jgi:HEAT repeat protein
MLKMPVLKTHKWPFFLILFCCFASAILGDSTAEALLLANFGSRFVPQLYLVNALFLFLTSTMMISLIDRTDRGLFFLGFAVVHGCVLLLVRLAIFTNASFLFLPLFSYAYVTKILLFMMFWTLANDLIDSRRAGREFPFIAAGGTLGAIGVSFSIPWLLKLLPAENLLLIWSGSSLLIAGLFLPIRHSFRNFFRPTSEHVKRQFFNPKMMAQDIQLVRSEPLLWNMAILYFLLFFIIPNQHFTFYSALKQHYSGSLHQASDIARFLGYFTGISMFLTFLLQITIAGKVLKKVGSTRSLFILPSVLAVVFAALSIISLMGGKEGLANEEFFAVLFWSIVLGVGTRIAFFDSFFSPNFQIFFSSLPKSIRGRGKLALEGVIKPLAIVGAGIWLGVVAPRVPLHVQMGVLLIVSLALIVQTLRLKRTYTQSLAHHLRSFSTRNTQWLSCVVNNMPRETIFLELLKDILNKEEHGVKEYIIELLTVINSSESKKLLLDHLSTSEPRTRANIVSALAGLHDPSLRDTFLGLLTTDADERVLANSILALSIYQDSEVTGRIERLLSHPHPRIRANATIVLWPRWQEVDRERLISVLKEMLASPLNREKSSALYALGEIGIAGLIEEFERFYEQYRARIFSNRSIWKQFIIGLAKSGNPRSIPVLLRLIDGSSKKQKNDIAVALRLLLRKGMYIDHFIKGLQNYNFLQRGVVLKAIASHRFSRSRETIRLLQGMARDEIDAVYSDWIAFATLDGMHHAGVELLRHAIVEESINERMQNLFYLASMLDATGEIKRVIHRLHHANKYVQARAFEVLDNTGDYKTNRWIIKLLETTDAAVHNREAIATLKLKPKTPASVVSEFSRSPNAWVRQCSSYAAISLSNTTSEKNLLFGA